MFKIDPLITRGEIVNYEALTQIIKESLDEQRIKIISETSILIADPNNVT